MNLNAIQLQTLICLTVAIVILATLVINTYVTPKVTKFIKSIITIFYEHPVPIFKTLHKWADVGFTFLITAGVSVVIYKILYACVLVYV